MGAESAERSGSDVFGDGLKAACDKIGSKKISGKEKLSDENVAVECGCGISSGIYGRYMLQ